MIEELAKKEFEERKENIVYAFWIYGTEDYGSKDYFCNPPLKVKITDTREHDICHRNGDWIVPYWNVEILEDLEKLRELSRPWIFGTSFSTNERIETSYIEPEEFEEQYLSIQCPS